MRHCGHLLDLGGRFQSAADCQDLGFVPRYLVLSVVMRSLYYRHPSDRCSLLFLRETHLVDRFIAAFDPSKWSIRNFPTTELYQSVHFYLPIRVKLPLRYLIRRYPYLVYGTSEPIFLDIGVTFGPYNKGQQETKLGEMKNPNDSSPTSRTRSASLQIFTKAFGEYFLRYTD